MNDKNYSTGISALVREALLDEVFMTIAYDDAERIARVFVDTRLREADTIIASEGRMFTRNGKMNIVQELDWCIYHGLCAGLGDVGFVSWKSAEIALKVIDTVNEHMGENPTWLTLLDGTSFARCYRVHDVLYTETIGDPNHLVSSVSPATHCLHVREVNVIGRQPNPRYQRIR